MITQQHLADPGAGAEEFLINSGLERDGVGQRVCLHADRTLTWDAEQGVEAVSCDYCPATLAYEPGRAAHLPAFYWRVRP